MQLNEIQEDLLKEAFNLGVGRAAQSLSELAGGEEILLSVPIVQLTTRNALEEHIIAVSGQEVCGITESFNGPFAGRAMMLYSQQESLELVRIMLGGVIPIEELSEMEGEALCEVGNVVLNAIISTLANLFETEIETDIPYMYKGPCGEVLDRTIGNSPRNHVLYLRMRFQFSKHDLAGHIGFFLDVKAGERLTTCLEQYFQKMMGDWEGS